MVILIDGSEKTQGTLWNTLQNFTLGLIENLRIEEDLFRVGVAQFSSAFQKEFYLNKHYKEEDMMEAIKKMTPLKKKRNIGAALNKVQEFFTTDKGSRIKEEISQNLLLITVGKSSDNITGAADGLRDMGIKVFAIGVTDKIVSAELTSISGSRDRVFVMDNFDLHTMNRTTQTLINSICTPPSSDIIAGRYNRAHSF